MLSKSLAKEERLELENLRLKIENKRLKRIPSKRWWCKQKVRYYLRCEYEIIKELSKHYSVNSLCKIMSINRSGYYKLFNRDIN